MVRRRPRSPARPAAAAGVRAATTAALAAMGAALLVYVGSLSNPFVYDDFRVIVDNRSILDLTQLHALFFQEASRPLANISYAIDHAIWGGGPFGFHLTNVLLHAANVGLLFLLVWRVAEDGLEAGALKQNRRLLAAFATAMVFAVHPILTQSVGYISSRPELLCALFFLLAFLSARRWIVSGGGGRWLALTFGFWVLAMASKEVAAMFPFVLFWYERSFFEDGAEARSRRFKGLHLPFLVVAGAAVAARLAVFALVEHVDATVIHWEYALLELDGLRLYLLMAALLHPLSLFHDVPAIPGLLTARALGGLALAASLVGLAWYLRTRKRLIGLGLAWFLLALVPSAGLVLLDRGEVIAEHRVYLASAGLFLAVGATIARLANYVVRPAFRVAVRMAFAAMLVVLAGRTMLRVALWSDPVALWTQASLHAPRHWLPFVPLGEALHNADRHEEAVAALREAIRLRPDERQAHGRLGVCLTELGRMPEAADTFQALLKLDARSTDARNGLATIALLSGEPEVARARYLESLSIDPGNVQARRGLAVIAETVDRDPAAALALCREIVSLAPNSPGAADCVARNTASAGGGR